MSITEEQRQFILDTLLPYKTGKQPFCRVEEKGGTDCRYRLNGNTCAFGKHMDMRRYKPDMEGGSASIVLDTHGVRILKKRARDIALTPYLWDAIQRVHDTEFDMCKVRTLESKTSTLFPEFY
jgi:hypothetical protein